MGFLNVSVSSRHIPWCFCGNICENLELLNSRAEWSTLREKIKSWACFDRFGLNDIFHWLIYKLTVSRFLFWFTEVVSGSLATEKLNYHLQWALQLIVFRLFDKSLICIKNNNNNNNNNNKNNKNSHTIEPCGIPALTAQILVHLRQLFVAFEKKNWFFKVFL